MTGPCCFSLFRSRGGKPLARPAMVATLLAALLTTGATARSAEKVEALGASGLFLAGVVANAERDTAAAAEYFREALRADPDNPGLIEQSFVAELIDGNLPEAFRLAERSVRRDRSNALAHVALGVRAMKARDYARAKTSFQRAGGNVRNPELTIALLRAWAMVGAGEVTGAFQLIDGFTEAGSKSYRDFFSGMMAEIAKRPAEAERRLESAYKADSGVMRVTEAYARNLSRRGKMDEARNVVLKWQTEHPGQPFLDRQAEALAKGEALPPLSAGITEGVAEVFYGLGASSSAVRDPTTAIIYMQFARYLSTKDEVITITLAEFFEQLRRDQRAADLYETIPATSALANRATISRAAALERLGKTEEAIHVLRSLLIRHPLDIDATDTLGTILRAKKRWVESIEVYDAAIRAFPRYEYRHWALFFGRAVGYERTKQWDRAESDFLKALDLLPPQARTPRERAERAQVLNYLGYSWVDMHLNIERSFDMLREAVSLSPGDGAIVDSLGWAFYRLGRYADAVRELERAIVLKAGDPTINDHLGDAYWRVGRQREARYKWSQALGLNPEPDDEAKIRKKLETGLEDGPAAQAAPPKPNGG